MEQAIYDACHYFRLLQNTSFGQYCGIITSFEPNHNAISREPANSDEHYKFDTYTKHVLKHGQTTKQYEDEAKRRFIEEPANMKLLIVVSKLLTGFDAPSCTYIYLDNELRDHNLFQAICRTNRLDGDDKDYGHIVDFKELFGKVQEAIAVYSSDELDTDEGDGGDNNVHLKNWLEEGRKKLDGAREALHYLCEPVPLPREVEQYLHYFCGDVANANALTEIEALRVSFYKSVATLVRAFAAIAQNLAEAGYSDAEAVAMQREVEFYSEIRSSIKKHSAEELDIKPPEGRVTLVAPMDTRPEVARAYAISKLGWIRDRQAQLRGQAWESRRAFVTRESHYVGGKRHLMLVTERDTKPSVTIDHRRITLTVRPGSDRAARAAALHDWHKTLLHREIPGLIERWEARLEVRGAAYFLQRMKTKWGSCNVHARHIRLNTELVKKPRDLLEYVVVHEMLHLRVPTHSEQFVALMSEHYPAWREAREELNALPIAEERWG